MVICKSTTHAYYPMSSRLPDLIRGSGRIRYVRGFLLTNPKGSGAIVCARGGNPEVNALEMNAQRHVGQFLNFSGI